MALAGMLPRSLATTPAAPAATPATGTGAAAGTRTTAGGPPFTSASTTRSPSAPHCAPTSPTGSRATAAAPRVQRRAQAPPPQSWVADRGVPAPIPALAANQGEAPASSSAPPARGVSRRGDDLEHLVEQVVEALEERVLGELERRGGRFLGAF